MTDDIFELMKKETTMLRNATNYTEIRQMQVQFNRIDQLIVWGNTKNEYHR